MAIVVATLEVVTVAVAVAAAEFKNVIAVVGEVRNQAGTYDGTLISMKGNAVGVGVAAAAAAAISGKTEAEAEGVGDDVDVAVDSDGVMSAADCTTISEECTVVIVAGGADDADGADSIPASPPFGNVNVEVDDSIVVEFG